MNLKKWLYFFQIYQQFPFSFEFTEKFLIMLADHSYSSNFGTFLCDSDYERNIMNVQKHTVSLWSYINQPDVLPNYLNCLYDPNAKVIWPSVAPISLVSALWFFNKFLIFDILWVSIQYFLLALNPFEHKTGKIIVMKQNWRIFA